MIEDPRDNPRPDEEPEAEPDTEDSYDDEISLDELEGDTSGFFNVPEPGVSVPEDAPQAVPGGADDDDEELGDEVSVGELEGDTAGFFEVYATPAPPESETPGAAGGEEMYEVQAEPSPAPPPGQQRAAPGPPPQASRPVSESDSIRRLHNVEVEVIATLGTTRMQIRDILGLQVGSVVELHRMVGEAVDVTLNGRLIARGEVVVVDEKFAIRVHEITGNGE